MCTPRKMAFGGPMPAGSSTRRQEPARDNVASSMDLDLRADIFCYGASFMDRTMGAYGMFSGCSSGLTRPFTGFMEYV